MDQHPIPQDVTGFQFKLIGSMTVKQFGYVAAGVILAVVLYYSPFKGIGGFFLKLFLIPIFGGSGFFIAFVPIEGRPVDIMASNFLKAIMSPNQYVYHKQGRSFSFSSIQSKPVAAAVTTQQKAAVVAQTPSGQARRKEEQLQELLMHTHEKVKNNLDEKENVFINALLATTPPPPAQSTVVQTAPAPAAPQLQQTAATPAPVPQTPTVDNNGQETPETLAKQEARLEQELTAAKQAETAQPAPANHQKVEDLEKQIQMIHQQKQHLEEELTHLKSQLNPVPAAAQATNQAPAAPQSMQAAPQPQSSFVHNVPQGMTKSAGLLNVSDTPNVVVGIVKDSRGNVLSHILVEVKDENGNPVRAFKTNILGQFASATPLSNGTYMIELEDPKKMHSFDVVKITPNGQIMLPIEIISHDAREELRKQLFN